MTLDEQVLFFMPICFWDLALGFLIHLEGG